MNIKKLEHCCLVVTTKGVTFITDPGSYSDSQNAVTGVHAIIITHEHGDHFHIDSVKAIINNNPRVTIIANASTGKLLDAAGLAHVVVDGRGSTEVNGVTVEAFDCKHEEVYQEMAQVQNTGYLIDGTFFIPGDSFQVSSFEKPVQVLALPVAGPWCRLPDAIRYALRVKPAKAFPVHDGMIRPGFGGFVAQMLGTILKPSGIEFIAMNANDEKEF